MICPVCATVFTGNRRTCSRSCAGSLPKKSKPGMSARDIARQLGISIPAVQQAEWRGLKKLRKALNKLGIFDSGNRPEGHHLTREN